AGRLVRRLRAVLRDVAVGELLRRRAEVRDVRRLRRLGGVLGGRLPLARADDELRGVADVLEGRLGRRDEERDEARVHALVEELLRERRAVLEVTTADDGVAPGGWVVVDAVVEVGRACVVALGHGDVTSLAWRVRFRGGD